MGCNYYLRSKPCLQCGHAKNEKHIGKSSGGWQFHFRGYREDALTSYEEWLIQLSDLGREIVDEYGEVISLEDFKDKVARKQDGINHFRIIMNTPNTDNERDYLKRNPPRYYDIDYNQRCWIDHEGYAFTGWEFC